MSTFTIVMIVILVILIGVLVGLYIFGKKAEKKQAEQQEQMAAARHCALTLPVPDG